MEHNKTKLTPSEEEAFNRALKLRKKGEYNTSINILERLYKEHPNLPEVSGMLASLYYEIDKYEHSKDFFKRTVELSPKSSLASLGYFHSLWSLEAVEDALVEIKRFLTLKYLSDYDEIIGELSDNLELEEYKQHSAIILEIGQLLKHLKDDSI